MTHETSGMRVLKIREGIANLLLTQERNRRVLLRKGFRDRAKARVDHPKVGDILRHLASQCREHVYIATSLDT